ncbi:MAG: hypothetical protein CVV51_06905 [Spirochaetae bacterium HGW-Spirochaetae-7]|jgi:menaquinone-dependent protoporphyrinogen IX oxidase|nr:MAG: hypothetical protein CVV51_06905 [Spirochaetae bacterium HGW-Spirochaetae-7]
MPNTVVVYVTRTGNARRIAEDLASRLDTVALLIEDKVNRNGLWGYLRAGYHASTRKATPIGDPGIDLSGADTVVMVQPIWASGIVPPLRTWLKAHESELRGKRLGLFTVCKGSETGPIRAAFEKEFMKLTAFGGIKERDDERTQSAAFGAFVNSLS